MFNNPQHFKLLLLLLCPLAFGQGHHLEPLHRNKRTLTTICVEIQPSGPQNEPYFMCKGADFANDPVPAAVPAAVAPPVPQPVPQAYQQPVPQSASQTYHQPASHQSPASAAQLSDQPIYNYGQPLTPFPSFPSFGAGFFHHPQGYESAPATSPSPTPSPPAPPAESPGAVAYGAGPAAAVAFPPAPTAPSYGLPAVPYPVAGGPAAAARGAAPVSGPAATPTAYAAPGAKKSPPATQHKSSASIGDSRHRVELDDSVLGMPNVGFKQEELHSQYRQPVGTLEPPKAFMPLGQPAAVPHPHYDDPIMRTFYASLGHEEPQLGQAAIPNEPLVAQVAPANAPYQEAPKYPTSSVAPADGNACNSCNRPCSAPAADNCPSYQHVIIAMPCYGQQQPTHYLAVPGQPPAAAPSLAPHGFAMQAPQGGPHGFAMSSPQVGAAFGMPSPQVGAPFGMAPVLNPFGPFGNLNPFNPFNRILGAAAPTTPQPRLHLFGAPEEGTTVATSTTTGPQPSQSTAKYSSNPTASPTKMSTESADVSVGASREAEHEQKEADEDDDETTDATESPSADDTTHDDADDTEQNKSVEAKPPTVNELVTKGEDKLKVDKRKRHNSRSRSYTKKLPKLT
ncbi:hypothetical protein KR215_001405 [Drosophila sulfurigaster]|nr:hypothetical protein KR215_001405 [Drosophila sulfurigaster]